MGTIHVYQRTSSGRYDDTEIIVGVTFTTRLFVSVYRTCDYGDNDKVNTMRFILCKFRSNIMTVILLFHK